MRECAMTYLRATRHREEQHREGCLRAVYGGIVFHMRAFIRLQNAFTRLTAP